MFLNICLAALCFRILLVSDPKSQKRNFLYSSWMINTYGGWYARKEISTELRPARDLCGRAELWWEQFPSGMPMEAVRVGVRPGRAQAEAARKQKQVSLPLWVLRDSQGGMAWALLWTSWSSLESHLWSQSFQHIQLRVYFLYQQALQRKSKSFYSRLQKA